MPSVRVVLPAVVGLALLVFGVQWAASGLQEGGGAAVAAVRSALQPIALGVAFILVSLAVSKRSRGGYVLGIATAIFTILAGVGVVILQIPYIAQGGMGAAFGGGFVVFAVLWMILWAGYGLSMRQARPLFAATWAPGDRTVAIVLSALVVFPLAAYVGLGVVETEASDTADAARTQAEALVAGTSLIVEVVDVSVDTSSAAGSKSAVERLVLELTVRSPEAYALLAVPTLCLADLATAQDPGYSSDTYCWGGPGRAVALDAAFTDLAIEAGTGIFQVQLTRGSSRCSFEPGAWNAELRILPRIAASAGDDGQYLFFAVSAQFFVDVGGAPPPSATAGATSDCIASTISP